jgi:hypothetical protein
MEIEWRLIGRPHVQIRHVGHPSRLRVNLKIFG